MYQGFNITASSIANEAAALAECSKVTSFRLLLRRHDEEQLCRDNQYYHVEVHPAACTETSWATTVDGAAPKSQSPAQYKSSDITRGLNGKHGSLRGTHLTSTIVVGGTVQVIWGSGVVGV